MKLCILGGRGMLGHMLYQVLKPAFGDVSLTVRGRVEDSPEVIERFGRRAVIANVDAMFPADCAKVLRGLRPDILLNCIGVLKPLPGGEDPITSIAVNGLFPHYLARAAQEWGGRVVHFSTDCVFSGARGNYREDDLPDANDLYGRSKLIGEPSGKGVLTLRTSIIGPELAHKRSLLEWFMSEARHRHAVKGFRNAVFSGLTTLRLAQIVQRTIQDFPELAGTYHVAGEAISKYDLLCALREAHDLEVAITADDQVVIDRTLNATRFERATGMARPAWAEMIAEMAEGVAA